ALVSGWLLAFTLSLDDVVIASFVSGPASTTLPIKIFSSVRLGVSPKINALATLLMMAVSLAAVIGWWLMYREDRRRQRDMHQALWDNSYDACGGFKGVVLALQRSFAARRVSGGGVRPRAPVQSNWETAMSIHPRVQPVRVLRKVRRL